MIKDNYKVATLSGATMNDGKAVEVAMDEEKVEKPAKLDFSILYYDVNKAELTSEKIELLKAVLARIKAAPDSKIFISGYADEQGSDAYNFTLSKRRVKGVIDYLISEGADMQKITSEYFGAVKLTEKCRKNPKCMTDADRDNRRVEIYLSK